MQAAARQLRDAFVGDGSLELVTTFPAFAPHTLGTMLARKYQTLTLAKYHLHLKEGVDASRAHGVGVLAKLVSALRDNGVRGPAKTRGERHASLTMGEIWSGLLRPQLGLLRRGRLGEIALRRTGLVEP
jgi:hypothetical protein